MTGVLGMNRVEQKWSELFIIGITKRSNDKRNGSK